MLHTNLRSTGSPIIIQMINGTTTASSSRVSAKQATEIVYFLFSLNFPTFQFFLQSSAEGDLKVLIWYQLKSADSSCSYLIKSNLIGVTAKETKLGKQITTNIKGNEHDNRANQIH